MGTSAKEFDASLGGNEVLPTAANTFKFAASRSVEIAAMTESILRPSKTKLIFQTLPVHMRRRVMSHNSKRLPRRLREGHMEQLKKSGLPPQQKRPSRKYRRRPANLLEEYTRRQRRNVWLETHIWHAKRFHMIEKWGHRLAYRPCDKAFRACYRASSAHCLMQDLSYYTSIQIRGDIEVIRDIFSSITSSACGLGIAAKAYLSGNREGSINIFKPYEYPYGFICSVNFLWTSPTEIWLFVHPAFAKNVESTLSTITNSSSSSNSVDNSKKRKIENKYSGIQIKVITGINRFRLTGPKSHAVLTNALKCVSDIKNIESKEWVAHIINKKHDLALEDKFNFWLSLKSLSSPAQLPPRIIIGLTVKDPRLSRPAKRTKAQLEKIEAINIETLTSIPSFLSSSPLWDEKVREHIKNKKVTNAEYIDHVTKTQIVPGEVNEDDLKLQPIPIVLIQRPGSQECSKKIGYNNGWDIIIPPGYGLPFWLTFVMFGGRSGGLRETESLAFESGEVYMPPDSYSGTLEEKALETKLKDKYFRKPPSKRVNFIKLAQPSPFICPWKILIRDWSGVENDKFFVLRDRRLINELQECIKRKKQIPEVDNMDSCLVAIYIQVVSRGSLQNHANICLPDVNDFKLKCITEPHHEDCNAKVRKEKKIEHRKLLKQLRRQRVKCKKRADNKQITSLKKLKKTSKEPSEYVQSMRELWLPSNVETVQKAGIRETMGYIVHGAFSFTEAKSCGVGYVTLRSLRTLLSNGINQVLVRNVTSRVYRLANFELIKS
ncbi:ribonucleases P/MRP protein subunit POP1 [Aricia agestis]|uniref:ribonucleases P/MRP protein subunit POP1 n=1 Tax=Aricia agestis TaxID=91739 RepID=UPI001C20A993|nr:ribonucleases P/MRP protein subunit POP1 [Aricia agestis]